MGDANFDPHRYRKDFPILSQNVNGRPLIYFDNAATSQKPRRVIEAITSYYEKYNSNVHRGVHHLSQVATAAYEEARRVVMRHINAHSEREVIFTRGTTDAINLVAATYGRTFVSAGDEILITELEHHSNIVPWQMLCEEKQAKLRVVPINERGEVELNEFQKLLSSKTRIVAIAHISNALGTIAPVKEMIRLSHQAGAVVLVDGAQGGAHLKPDMQELDCDFYALSAHKMYGPTGTGVLYGKEELLEKMPPYQGGGDMIKCVTFEKTTYNELPLKFEAGTPNIEGVIGMAEAIRYLDEIGFENIAAYEDELLAYGYEKLSKLDGIRFIGTAANKASVLSFLVEGVHPYDTGIILDKLGIAVRTGHHCTQPLMEKFNIPGTVRASFSFYNTREEIDQLVEGVKKVQSMFL